MSINPLNPEQLSRLQKSIEWSNKQLRFPREKRVKAVKLFAGSHYDREGMVKRIPVNMLAMAVMIYVRLLAPRAPRAMFTTRIAGQKATAANMELAINMIPEEIKLGETLQRMVLEAIFSPWGIVKCGLHTVGQAAGHEYGESFVDNVTFDDYFVDMNAKHMDHIDYEGNDYWLDYDEVMESEWSQKKALDGLKPDEYSTRGEEGEDRAETTPYEGNSDTFKEKLWMRDVWLPDEEMLLTYAIKTKRVLNIVEWKGQDRGPYHKLGFANVPGNLMPLPPVALWRDLHELGNSLFRKLDNQAEGQKSVMGFPGGSNEGAENFKKAKDQDGITFTNGQKPEILTTSGVDPKTLAFFMEVQQLQSHYAGNLDSLGGLAPQTGTVGQDKLIAEAAGAQLRDMSAKTVDVTRDVFQALAYYEWSDPVKRRTLEKPIPGSDIKILVEFSKKDKKGKIDSYNLAIDVHSMQDDSPTLKLQKLGMAVQQYILPFAPMIEAAGGIIDVQAILRNVARYAALPELAEIVTFTDQEPVAGSSADPSGKPANTTRTYERVTNPGQTPRGASQNTQQILLGGDQPDTKGA